MGFFLGTQERVRNSRGKRATSVRATGVLLYIKKKNRLARRLAVSPKTRTSPSSRATHFCIRYKFCFLRNHQKADLGLYWSSVSASMQSRFFFFFFLVCVIRFQQSNILRESSTRTKAYTREMPLGGCKC